MRNRVRLAVLGIAFAAACSDSTGPTKAALAVAVTADSPTVKGAVVGTSYRCTVNLTAQAIEGRNGDTAAFTSATLVITPVGGSAQTNDLTGDMVAVMFGAHYITAGKTLTTQQVFASVNSTTPYSAAFSLHYIMNGGAITVAAPATFNCT